MSAITKKIIVILTIVGLVFGAMWTLRDKDYEPIITTIGLFCSLIALLFIRDNSSRAPKSNDNKNDSKQNIKITSKYNSTNYISGRDIKINRYEKDS